MGVYSKPPWLKTYNPKTDAELHLGDPLVTNDWLLTRSLKKLAEVESEIFAAEPNALN